MAHAIPKLEVLIDLSRPVEEITEVITLVISSHPGKQKEILEAVDLSVGEALAKFEENNIN
ncbi:hypothetical protein BVG16_13565 [Paenibacillus selenitireducens]|uniref:Uncharacterized protein n=1 Tax=Paenibacillus selenitireducens TaxID=1324314 RepID=A0A1T2XCC2_9BACL|nr:hypothetical protein [Paenibacillus selenitireducens]OPA77478.1 hypothetical protein BVG16_13565 [Paenibacillus selenitireducens]